MIQRPTLHVLAEAAEIGLPEAAAVHARPFDPVLRPFIRKNVRKAIDAASTRTTSKSGEHLLRLAFLDYLGTAPKDLDANDERAVEAAFATLAAPYLPAADAPEPRGPEAGAYRTAAPDRQPAKGYEAPKKPRRRWPITTPIALVLALATVAGLAVFLVPRLMPSPMSRFRKTALGAGLGEPLTTVVAAGARGGNADARAKVLSPAVKKQLGNDAFDSLGRVVDEVPHVRGDGVADLEGAMAPLFFEVNDLDAKLAAKKIPAHLHAYGSMSSGRPTAWLMSYFVEQREELTFDGKPVRFVWGRRLDNLNMLDATLYKAEAEDWAVVSMDRVEQEVVQTLLAPLAKGAPLAPDESAAATSPRAELSRTAGRVIAAELVAQTKVSPSDAEALQSAIAQRNEIAGSLSKIGYRLPASSAIEEPASTVRGIESARDDNPRDAALLSDYLRMNNRAAGYRRDVAPAVAVLARLEEEELAGLIVEQKRLDGAPLPKLEPVPSSLRARAVVASSLALVARPQTCPKLALWRLAWPMFDADSNDDEAASLALHAVLAKLGVPPHVGVFGYAASEAFMRDFTAALELPPERVREAAAAAYLEIFGHAPPAFVRKTLP